MEKEKFWWCVFLRDKRTHKIIDGCRQYAATRRLAKEQAAQYWHINTIDTMTAFIDRSS